MNCIKTFAANAVLSKQALFSFRIAFEDSQSMTERTSLFVPLFPPDSTPPPIEKDRWTRDASTYSKFFHRFHKPHRFTENRVFILAEESYSIGSRSSVGNQGRGITLRAPVNRENAASTGETGARKVMPLPWLFPRRKAEDPEDQRHKNSIDHVDVQTYLRPIGIWRYLRTRIITYRIVLTELKNRVLGRDARNAGGQPAPRPEKPKPAPKPEKKKPAPKPGRRGDREPQEPREPKRR